MCWPLSLTLPPGRRWPKTILYPLAERIIPDAVREPVLAGYQAAEALTPADFTRYYEEIMARYEAETASVVF